MVSKKVKIINPVGLHARPANNFVKCAASKKSQILIRYKGQEYNGKSIITVLKACISSGSEIEIVADGEDETNALNALVEAVNSGLGE